MTQTQASELERAINRATDYGIEVVAKGRRKADNARIYCTTSHSDPSRWHVVAIVGKRLVCDCKSRTICTHRAAVHMDLAVEATKRQAQAEAIEAALQAEQAKVREAIVQASQRPQVRGVNDVRPLNSVFK